MSSQKVAQPPPAWSNTFKNKNEFEANFSRYPVFEGSDFLFVKKFFGQYDRVLDVGAGSGLLAPYLKLCADYKSFDVDLQTKQDYHNFQNIPRNYFTGVASVAMFEHLTTDEIRAYFSLLKDIAPTLVFVVPNPWASYGVFSNDYTHKSFWGPRAYGGLLRETGWKGPINFFRITESKLRFIKEFTARFVGVDYCFSMGIVARLK